MLHKTKNRDMIKCWESRFTQRCQNRPFKGRSKNLNHGPSWLGHHWSVRPFIQTSRPVSLRTRWIKPTDYRLKNRWNFNFNPLPSSIIEWKFEFSNFSNFWKFQIFELEIFSSVFDNPSWSKMTIFDLFDISNYFLPKPTHIWNISFNFQKLVMVFIYYIFNNKI